MGRINITIAGLVLFLTVSSFGITITVDDDGPADYSSIQDAIDSAWYGPVDIIEVMPGTYNERIYFNGWPITVTSINPNDPNIVESTIINGPAEYTVNFDFAEDSDSVLTGFTITGYGIYCQASSPTITKNIIRDFSHTGINGLFGAAPTVTYNIITNTSNAIVNCDGLIDNNTIMNNSSRGIDGCDGIISNNIISSNNDHGLYQCNGMICNNRIKNNNLRGLYQCNASIFNNIISGNKEGGFHDCDGLISNNLISGNIASTYGGGFYYCDGTIRNNTIIGNKAGSIGGGLGYCNAIVKNNIIAFNRAPEGGGIGWPCENSFNAYWANSVGNFGNGAYAKPSEIYQIPLFAADGYWDDNGTPSVESDDFWVDGDYHLQYNSPCINAGDPNYVPQPGEVDMDGDNRIRMGRVDMGADETGPNPADETSYNPADFDESGQVDFLDFGIVASAWLSEFGDPEWNDLCDISNPADNIINTLDFAAFSSGWLWQATWY